MYKLKKIVGSYYLSAQFIKVFLKNISFNIYIMQQTACLVVKPITIGNFAFLFNYMLEGGTSDSMTVLT